MICFITGGARSGKSRYAGQLAKSLSEHPVYVATARIWDEDFRRRVDRHITDRDEHWTVIEEEEHIGKIDYTGKVTVIDCLTLWLANFFADHKGKIDRCLELAKSELEAIDERNGTVIIISNELGMGLHAETESGRKFTDLQGWINQYVAEKADKVILMVSGIPITIKETNENI